MGYAGAGGGDGPLNSVVPARARRKVRRPEFDRFGQSDFGVLVGGMPGLKCSAADLPSHFQYCN